MKNYQIKSNLKYLSNNPMSNFLINNFNNNVKSIINKLSFNSILDVGCGEGVILQILKKELQDKKCVGIDLDTIHVKMSASNAPFCNYNIATIYSLPFKDNSFETVLCLEVLEHLEFLEKAIQELKRVSFKNILISVPREPIWRFLNMVRLKYLSDLGNTSGHINHWTSRSIFFLLKKYFKINKIRKPLPWTMILCENKFIRDTI